MLHKHTLCLICVALIFDFRVWTCAELYTAISDMEQLLVTQKKIIVDLDNHIQKEEKRLGVLKKRLNMYRREHNMALVDVDNYLGNPINAFTLMKRLTIDLDFIEKTIKSGTEFVRDVTASSPEVYPTEEDLKGAAQALTRLQKTYKLDIRELAQGRLNGIVYSTPLSASDCYELGRMLYLIDKYSNSLRWMEEALRKYKVEDEVQNLSEVQILEYISYLHYLLDDGLTALEWTNKLLTIEPNNQHALKYIPYYVKKVRENKKILEMGNALDDEDEDEIYLEADTKMYETLCRGEMELPSQIVSQLKCSYLTKNHPFLKLAPIKTEQVYIAPDVFVYYGVMSDDEIEHIKTMARPRLKRASVVDFMGKGTTSDYRIAKLAWLKDEDSPVVTRVSQRVEDFTGLSIASAEKLQVLNYGIGGYYVPHHDNQLKSKMRFENVFDKRLATVIFYGGATVFLELGLSVFPVKNAALFWMNLHPSGENDVAMLHGGCPVLRGSKWISSKWIHQDGQELLAPCDLKYQPEEVLREIIKAKPRV
ncbi:PREDICTED: prolyl 4-hydroxylase subunit alpha-1-like isoform X2 [Papilio polytes]|uniref:prolyl 4-hydroxylase subunit alpha-1-like isoform X2 n=1 Tax=Papilio polytes TaxID=76194 RepID=UPI00067683D8|nr:PREDICTED: prolyl 4-hydroxylase subunit alpha-1-like isoform X2 [Papilio polytes]